MRCALADLSSHSQPVNRAARLHTSGGDRTGREELLWEQNEQYHNIASRSAAGCDLKAHAKLYDAICKLMTLQHGTFYYKDYLKHVRKLWNATHAGGGKNSRVRFNEALARARKRYEATT